MDFLGQDLPPGEYICPKCCGQGRIESEKISTQRKFIIVTEKTITHSRETCNMCYGRGSLTWTELARGRRSISLIGSQMLGYGYIENIFYIGFEWTSFFMTPLIKRIYTRRQIVQRRRLIKE